MPKKRIRNRPSTSEAVAIFLATPWMQNAGVSTDHPNSNAPLSKEGDDE